MTTDRPGSFLWHDYETSGTHPALDRPLQFAAIRTDADFKPIGEPVMLYCKPPRDILPHPGACLVTGISPQYADSHGVVEAEFITAIHQQMMQPGTCSAGYNSIRFDDEFTRHTLYRNFYDAYEREWKNGNSRWDLIDVVRLCSAVRPEGITWPVDDEGVPTYRLEYLTEANCIEQTGAHDALVDVRATIDVARLIKNNQPKLFDYALSLRNKHTAAKVIDLGSNKPLLHISAMFGNRNCCASVVLPLCLHPVNRNAVICFDLRYAPDDFLQLSLEEIRERVFTSRHDLGEKARIPLKSVHLNKSPMLAPVTMVDEVVAGRINLDMGKVRQHYDALLADPSVNAKARDVFSPESAPPGKAVDVDNQLYGGGFFSDADKAVMADVRDSSPQQLATQSFVFEDARLDELLFRYRANNWPDSLSPEEQQQWYEHCYARLTRPDAGGSITLDEYQQELERLYEGCQADPGKALLLEQLMDWPEQLL